MALPRDQRFQNLTVDFKKMNKLSMRDRMNMLGTRQGADLLSSLDPSQLKSLFPDYYKKDEGLSQTLSAITGRNIKPSETVKDQTAGRSAPPTERDLRRRNTVNRAREEERLPEWARKLGVTAGKSDMPQLTSDQKTVLKDLRQGKIASDDPRVSFLNQMTPEQRQKAGIIESEQDGKKSFTMSAYSDDQIAENLRSSPATFSARERATLDFISNREGSKDPNIIFGDVGNVAGSGEYSKKLRQMGHTKPLTEMSINEVVAMQKDLISITKGRLQHSPGKGTSAVGSGQMISSTLLQNLRDLGIPSSEWDKIKFDKTLQERLTIQNFKSSGIGDPNADPKTWNMNRLGQQYESVNVNKGYRPMTSREIEQISSASTARGNSNPTAQDIASERQRLEKESEKVIASSQARPQLPAGLDPKFVETYNRLPIAQAQQVASGLSRVSQELGEAGIRKFNTEFLGNPSRFSDSSVADRFNQMRTSAQDASQRFLSFSPDAKITSTYRDPNHPIERAKRTPGAHSRGEAIDVRTEGFSTEQIQQKVASLKRAGFNYVLLEGNPPHIHAEIREGRDFEIKNLNRGNPSISLEQAQQAAAGAKFRDFDETQPQAQQQAQSETPLTPALSYGGEVQTDAKELTAVPMGQARTDVAAPLDRRDNMAVIDEKGQTQFTINDNETVSLKNGRAEVQTEEMIKSDEIKPIQDSLKREERENEKEQANRLEMVRSQAQTDNQINDTNMQNINDSAVSATEELFRTPSFTRAMKERHFMKDESPMGGNHFSPV